MADPDQESSNGQQRGSSPNLKSAYLSRFGWDTMFLAGLISSVLGIVIWVVSMFVPSLTVWTNRGAVLLIALGAYLFWASAGALYAKNLELEGRCAALGKECGLYSLYRHLIMLSPNGRDLVNALEGEDEMAAAAARRRIMSKLRRE